MIKKQPDTPEQAAYNASESITSGVVWAVSMRWAIRFIGLFSTLILARLLTPDDFGVAAMATLVLGLLLELSQFGSGMLLIRKKDIDQAHMDTAWTIVLLQQLLTAVALVTLAVPVSGYFQEPRVVEVMFVLAATVVINGFQTIGPTLLRRELKFAADFRFNVWIKVMTFVATVSAALILRNYWALIAGHFVGSLASVFLSYIVHPYRPHFSLMHAREYVVFGASIVPFRIANMLREMSAQFLVAGTGNTSALGSFRIANDISTLFTREIVTPMGRGLLPNYTRLADDPVELSRMYRKVLGLVVLLCIPAGAGVSAVSEDLVLVLLGSQWGFASDLIEFIALGGAVYAISSAMINQILVATGREKSAAVLAWVRLAITVPILWIGLELGGVLGLAKATIIAPLACLPIIYLETRRAVTLSVRMMIGLFWRPLIGAGAMYISVQAIHTDQFEWPIARLVVEVVAGSSVFAATTMFLWFVSKRPNSAEKTVLKIGTKLLRKVQGKTEG